MLLLDTPGGLLQSMNEMTRLILNSKVPVITYIYPAGASCGSAGVYILYASHVSAMAPATNIGSATPVSLQPINKPKGTDPALHEFSGNDKKINRESEFSFKQRKLINHTRSQIRSFAQFYGRNSTFAEKTITEAKNISSEEAYKIKAIDILVSSIPALLKKLQGRKIRMASQNPKEKILDLKDAEIIEIKQDYRRRFLNFLSNPNLAYLLILLGIFGLFIELSQPGLFLPGIVGVFSLLLGFYAMQTLPLDYTAFALLAFGFVLFMLEIYIMSYGLLFLAGLVAVILGSLLFVKSAKEFSNISLFFVLFSTLLTSILASFIAYLAFRSQKRKVVVGDEFLLKEIGIAITEISEKKGYIHLHGERWQARSETKKLILQDKKVSISKREGLVLFVKEIE